MQGEPHEHPAHKRGRIYLAAQFDNADFRTRVLFTNRGCRVS